MPATGSSFASELPSPPPDYANAHNWAAIPDNLGSAAQLPRGFRAPLAPAADVFFIHPTTLGPTRWTQDLSDPGERTKTDSVSIARQATAFAGCCRIFAPRYRQASSRAFAARDERGEGDGQKAYALALDDIMRAFDWYLTHENKGRPFIIAGHSQGAGQLVQLVGKRIAGTSLSRQMIAAYVIGMPLTQASAANYMPGIPVCASLKATGCAIVWNSYAWGTDTLRFRERAAAIARGRGLSGDLSIICVNPLTFDAGRPTGDRLRSRGALLGNSTQPEPLLVQPQAVAAECRDGVLYVDTRTLRRPALVLPTGSLHSDDVALFWADIWADAVRRSKAWMRR